MEITSESVMICTADLRDKEQRIAALEAENAALHEKIRETFEDAIKDRDRKADKLCDTVDGWKRLGLLCPVIESSYLHLNVICMTMQDQLLKERAENAALRQAIDRAAQEMPECYRAVMAQAMQDAWMRVKAGASRKQIADLHEWEKANERKNR